MCFASFADMNNLFLISVVTLARHLSDDVTLGFDRRGRTVGINFRT